MLRILFLAVTAGILLCRKWSVECFTSHIQTPFASSRSYAETEYINIFRSCRNSSPVFMSTDAAESITTTKLPEGLAKNILKEGNGPLLDVGDIATVRYRCYLPGQAEDAPFAKSKGEKFVVGEGMMVDGWELAIQTMREGERSTIQINDPKYGYGADGLPPKVPPNAKIELDLEILNVEAGMDLGTIASAEPLKPRTPAAIKEAYDTRIRERAALEATEKKEGLEGLLDRFKSFYFFGFFGGETGQAAPWYLKPSITFPLIFVIVGAAFALTLMSGAISQRGAPVTDELDEIILNNILL